MSCIVDPADIAIIRGNTQPPMKWQFLVSENPDVFFDLTGSVMKLTISWPGTKIEKSSDIDPDFTVDLPNSIVTWAYSSADSRAFPLGRIARYELERWIGGSQQSLISGHLAVDPGQNPD